MILEKLYRFWNMIHYFIFIWQNNIFLLIDYINPITWLLKINSIQNFYKKNGIDNINEFINKTTFENKEYGISIISAGIHMGGLLVLMEYSIFNFIQVINDSSLIQYVWEDKVHSIIFITALLVPPGLINYFMLFRKDKYLGYFKKFDKMPKHKKRAYGWKAFFAVLSFWMLFIGSLVLLIIAKPGSPRS